jgi:hypothetical protein
MKLEALTRRLFENEEWRWGFAEWENNKKQ